MCDIETLRLFVNERLTAVAEDILAVFVRTIVQYQQQIDLQHRQLEFLTPQDTSDLTDFLPVCEEEKSPEQQERRPDLLQEEPQPTQIKEEQQERFHRPEEDDRSAQTLLAVKSEYSEIRETEPLANTSNEHVKTQADVENCGASQPTVDVQLISSHCSESDTEDSDDWEETREEQSLKSHNEVHTVQGQRFSLTNKLSQDLVSGRQSPSMSTHTVESTFSCTFCGKTFAKHAFLKRHTRTHTGEKPFGCTVCGKTFTRNAFLKRHTRTHTGEKPFGCTVCGKTFNLNGNLKRHTVTHTFSCILCGNHFSSTSHLKKHMEEIHGELRSFLTDSLTLKHGPGGEPVSF